LPRKMSPVRPRSPAPNRILPAVHFSYNPAGQNHIAHPRRGTQVVRERSAKPLCVGSIPTRASKISLIMSIKPADLACLGTPSQVCLFSEYSCLFCNFRPVLGRGSDQNRTEIRLISFLKNESYVPNKLVSNPKWQPESEVVATGFFRGNESGYSENRRDRAMGWK
jgi:hypothetical protein